MAVYGQDAVFVQHHSQSLGKTAKLTGHSLQLPCSNTNIVLFSQCIVVTANSYCHTAGEVVESYVISPIHMQSPVTSTPGPTPLHRCPNQPRGAISAASRQTE